MRIFRRGIGAGFEFLILKEVFVVVNLNKSKAYR